MARQEKGKRPLSAREVLGARYDWVYPALFAIGYEDGRRPLAHFRLSRHPNLGAIDDQEPAVVVCSQECLRAFASSPACTDPPSFTGPNRSIGKPRK